MCELTERDPFTKGPLTTPPKNQLTQWHQSLMNEDIINKPSDLAKLLFVLKSGITDKDWPQNETDLRQFVIDKVRQFFDDSGESATETCFETALEYGLICFQSDPNTGFKRYVEGCPKNEKDLIHDWFCFDCDKLIGKNSRQFLKCETCFRVFHRKCSQEFDALKDYKCRYCPVVDTNGYINSHQSVNQNRLNRVIGFLIDFVKLRMGKKFEEIDLKFESNQFIYVFKDMNWSLMKKKADNKEYKTLSEFKNDFKIYTHNLWITQVDFDRSDISQSFTDLKAFMLKEFKELQKCVDCYERANDKELQQRNKDWFCEPCQPIHKPVFVKIKCFPYWPAKQIKILADKKRVEVCFFEVDKNKDKSKGIPPIFKKSEVKPIDIRDIDDLEILNSIKGIQRLVKPMELLLKYVDKIKEINNDFIQIFETLKKNLSQNITKSQSFVTNLSDNNSIDESIENVVKSNATPSAIHFSPPPRSRKPSKGSSATIKKATQSKSKAKSRKKKLRSPHSSNASTRSSSPVTQTLPNTLINQLNDSVDSLSDKPSLHLSNQIPTLDFYGNDVQSPQNTTNRRSGRIAKNALITPQKTETKKKSEIKASNATKHKHQNKSIDGTEPMEIDFEDSQQTIPTNELLEEITAQSRISGVRIDSNGVHQSSNSNLIDYNSGQNICVNNNNESSFSTPVIHSKSVPNTSQNSSIENNSVEAVTIVSTPPIESVLITSTAMTSTSTVTTPTTMTSHSKTTTPSTSTNAPNVPPLIDTQSICTPLMSVPSTSYGPIVTAPPLSSSTASTSFEGTVNQNENMAPNINYSQVSHKYDRELVNRLKQKLNDLKTIDGPLVSKIDLEEKLILVDHYVNQLIKEFESINVRTKQLENELQEVKCKRWCVVCRQLAKHYCCVRFYCSRECQSIDWKNGHGLQCLHLNK